MILSHVVESQQFTVPLLMELFDRTRRMERVAARGGTLDYQGRIMASLFYRPSTRTRFSFEAAMYRLGGKVLSTEQAGYFSSEVEGEQLEDTIRIIGTFSDVIVLRHTEEGGARRAAFAAGRPPRRRWRQFRHLFPACHLPDPGILPAAPGCVALSHDPAGTRPPPQRDQFIICIAAL